MLFGTENKNSARTVGGEETISGFTARRQEQQEVKKTQTRTATAGSWWVEERKEAREDFCFLSLSPKEGSESEWSV